MFWKFSKLHEKVMQFFIYSTLNKIEEMDLLLLTISSRASSWLRYAVNNALFGKKKTIYISNFQLLISINDRVWQLNSE